jgi:hypothetical protein
MRKIKPKQKHGKLFDAWKIVEAKYQPKVDDDNGFFCIELDRSLSRKVYFVDCFTGALRRSFVVLWPTQ